MVGRLLRSLAATIGRKGPERAEEEALRQWVMEQLRTRPLKYLEQVPAHVEPVGPGILLGGHLVDYHAVRLRFADGGEHLLNVSKMHLMVHGRQAPELLEACLAHMLKSCASDAEVHLDSWAAVQPAILPVVKGQPHPEAVSMQWGSLTIQFVVDTPDSMAYVSPDLLRTWGRTPDDVKSVALANASLLHAGVTVRKLSRQEAGGFHIWAVDTDPDYSASTVLLSHVVDQVPVDRDDLYVIVPQRSSLYFVEKPGSAVDRIVLLGMAIQMYEGGGYPVSPFLHVWSEGCLTLATAQEITGGDTRFLYDGGVLVPGSQSGKPMLVRIP